MEEAKAVAYYDELTRKGEGAARFKQGLGFSSSSSAASNSGEPPARGSALVSSSSSFLSSFVKASSPSKTSELEKQSRLESIQNKLKKPKAEKPSPRVRNRSRSRERDIDRRPRRRSRSRSRSRDGDRHRRRRRSRSRSGDSDGDRRRREERRRDRSRSSSPRDRRGERRNRRRSSSPAREKKPASRNVGVDYSRLIQGYDKMTPAERVKAKMKLQLAETVEKDATKGSSGWERFEFNKDAPLDDEEIEATEDDAALVKHIGQSFLFSSVDAKQEQKIQDAHDEAMFGVPVVIKQPITTNNEATLETDPEAEAETSTERNESNGSEIATSLLSEKVLAKQQGSWRDRARRQMN